MFILETRTSKRVRELIGQLDSPDTLQLRPQQAEILMGEILQLLLENAGYRIERVVDHIGMDFLARKDGDLPDAIAIEYKHTLARAIGSDAIHRILGAAMSAGMSRAMLVTNARFTHAARELIRRNAPTQVDLLDIDALRSWLGRLEKIPELNFDTVHVIRTVMCRELIKAVVSNPKNLDRIEWREMEHLQGKSLRGLDSRPT